MMPLKHVKVETLVGKGVFKVSCKSEELILYSLDGANSSQRWTEAIAEAAEACRANAATLRKESSKREPARRPDLLKLRRESLSQIMLKRQKKCATNTTRMVLRSSAANTPEKASDCSSPVRLPFSSPRKRKEAGTSTTESPIKVKKADAENATPKVRRTVNEAIPMLVQLRAKKVNRPAWKTLSLSRKEKLKEEEAKEPTSLFRSPSLYANEEDQQRNAAMSSYLSGRMCPLTPSQQPTDVAHLANSKPSAATPSPAAARRRLQMELKEKIGSPEEPPVSADHFLKEAEREQRSACRLM